MTAPPEHKSAFAKALEERARKAHEFEVADYFGLAGKPIPKLAIWVNTKSEQDKAIVAAHKYVAIVAGESEAAKRDGDLLADAKLVEILFRACRDASDTRYPAFPGPQWMRDQLTTQQIASLVNLYNEVAKRDGTGLKELSAAMVEAYASMAADNAGSDMPDVVLAALSREELTQLFVLLSVQWKAQRAAEPTPVEQAAAPDPEPTT